MEFDFDVIDGASSVFKAMDSSLAHFEKTLSTIDAKLGSFEQGAKHVGSAGHESAGGIKDMFEAMLGAEGVEHAVELFEELGEKVLELGEEFVKTGVEMADFRNTATLSIAAITGDTQEGADEFLETLEYMSKGTKDTGEQMFAQFQRMGAFTKQFGKKATEDVIAGIADVRVAFGQGAGDAVLSAIQNSQAMGKFDERALRGLKESGVATPERLIAVLAQQHKTSTKQIDALLKAGKISAAEGTNAILGLIRQDLDKGGAIGGLSKLAADKSVGVQVKNLKDKLSELFEKVDTKPLVDAMQKLGALFDPNTERGKKLEAMINRIFKALGDLVSWATEGNRISETFDKIAKYAEMAWPFIKGLGIIFGAVVAVFAAGSALLLAPFYAVGAGVVYAIGSLGKLWEWLKGLGTSAVKFGGDFVDGLIQGITNGIGRAEAAVKNLGKSIVSAAKSVLKIQSPSRVMFELGGHTAEGMRLGIEAKIPQVRATMTDVMLPTPKYGGAQAAMAALAPPPIQLPEQRSAPNRSYQGGDINVSVHIGQGAVGEAGDHAALAKLIAEQAQEQLQPMVRAEIVRFLEDDAIAN